MGFFLTTFRTGHETAFRIKYKIILIVLLLNNTDFFFYPKKILIYSKQTVFCFSRTLHKDNIIVSHYQLYFLLLCTWYLFLFCFGLGFFVWRFYWMILVGCFLGYYSFKIYKLNTNQQITFIIFIFDNINSILVLFFKLSLKITLFTVIHKACIVPSQK